MEDGAEPKAFMSSGDDIDSRPYLHEGKHDRDVRVAHPEAAVTRGSADRTLVLGAVDRDLVAEIERIVAQDTIPVSLVAVGRGDRQAALDVVPVGRVPDRVLLLASDLEDAGGGAETPSIVAATTQ